MAIKGKKQTTEHIKKRMIGASKSWFKKDIHPKTEFKIGHHPTNGFQKGNKGYWLGKKRPSLWNKESKCKVSKAMTGRKLSQEHKLKMSVAMKKRRKNIILPVKDTSIEIKIQNYLKQLGITFFTHQYIKEIEHGYQCDIFIPFINLVIECDGDYWHKYPIGREIDHIRTSELLQKGFKVLRLWEFEINQMSLDAFKSKLDGVKNKWSE